MNTNLIGSRERSAAARGGRGVLRDPWVLAALDASCAWCARPLASCCCLDRPGPPARPLPALDWLAQPCHQCRQAPAVPGGRQCEGCRAIQRRSHAKYRAGQVAAGRCLKCTRPPKPGRQLCDKHAAVLSRLSADWRAKCAAEGRCQRCPAQAETGRTMCRACCDERAAYRRAQRTTAA